MHRFKAENSLVKRQEDSLRIRRKFPDRVPVILECREGSNVPPIDKYKYLVPNDLTVGQFAYVIRRRAKVSPEQAMFLFVANILPVSSMDMGTLDFDHRDEDGFLYITYSGENTFGDGIHIKQYVSHS